MQHPGYRLFLPLVFFLSSVAAFSQQLIGEVSVQAEVADLQCYTQGDSILLVFLENIPDTKEFERHAYWLYNNRLDTVNLDVLDNRFLTGTSRHADKQYYYFVDKHESRERLMAFSNAYADSTFQILSADQMKGDLLAIIQDGDLFVISYEPEKQRLTIKQIKGETIVSARSYHTAYNLSFYYLGSIGVFERNDLPGVANGSAEFKIYKRGNKLFITIDQPKFGKSSRTEVLTFDLETDGDADIKIVPADKKALFRSYLDNDTLYRVKINRKQVKIEAIELTSGKTVAKATLKADDPASDSMRISTRLGHLSQLHRNDNLVTFIQTSGNFFPSIVKYNGMDGGSEIVVGSYIYSENTGAGTGGFGLGKMIGYHHPSAYKLSSEPQGISRYFHLVNTGSGLAFETGDYSVADRLDSYELRQIVESQLVVGVKGYVNLPRDVVAIYHLPDFKKISIISFSK
jgi:hypothetical protein